MKLSKIIILTGLLTLTSSLAFADEIPGFKAVDTNGDKSINAAEFAKATAAGVEATFKELDEDKDGKLSSKEYSAVLDDCE